MVNIVDAVSLGFCRWDHVHTIQVMELGLLERSLCYWRKGVFDGSKHVFCSYCGLFIHRLQHTLLTKLINSAENLLKIMAWWDWDMVLEIYPLESHLCLLPVSFLNFMLMRLLQVKIWINEFSTQFLSLYCWFHKDSVSVYKYMWT